jgi:hypothetical protein
LLPVEARYKGKKNFCFSKLKVKIFEDFRKPFQILLVPIEPAF